MPDRRYAEQSGERPAFGRIDPVVWIPVFALLVVAVILVIGGAALFAFIPVLIGVLLVLFDARMNRPPAARSRRSR